MDSIYPIYPIPTYKSGGIHIKKKNRGKFNALKKRTGKSTETGFFFDKTIEKAFNGYLSDTMLGWNKVDPIVKTIFC